MLTHDQPLDGAACPSHTCDWEQVWMIDFGKTSGVDGELSHRVPWTMGTREDGYLIGLDAIIEIVDGLRAPSA